MELTPLGIEGAWLAETPVWSDDRGFFREWFRRDEIYTKTGFDFSVQQANISESGFGVIRGIHYSLAPQGQAKWITCLSGSILDVIVDIRPNSPTFKKIEYVNLEAKSEQSLLIGAGLGHGFVSLNEKSVVSYLLNSKFNPLTEYSINFFDKELNIQFENSLKDVKTTLSTKDRSAPKLKELQMQNLLPIYVKF
jgi:dTDP-4-dehydrorhamnose 3,5-epimerase